MSDAVTNIDDLVTSFRRLVAAPAPVIAPPPVPRLVLMREQRIDLPVAAPVRDGAKSGKPRLATLILMNPLNVAAKPTLRPAAIAPPPAAPAPSLKGANELTRETEAKPAAIAATSGDAAARRQKLEATIAELEAAVSATDTDWEPDGSEVQPHTGRAAQETPIRSALLEAARYVPKASAKAPADAPAVKPNIPATDGTMLPGSISEQYLRRLVAEVVRAELQGAFGQRATANVRKLVREEIDAALRDCGL